ncbi:hypothetical protein ACYVOU_002341 [Vibrio cholerae]|nr:hypothetical protein [Vibrio cholerae]
MNLLTILNSLWKLKNPKSSAELKPVKTYVVWSPSYVMSLTRKKAETYEELQVVEEAEGVISSMVETSNIEQIIQAFLNETDHEMLYHEI